MGACVRRWLCVLAATLLYLFMMHTAWAKDDVPPNEAFVAALQKAISRNIWVRSFGPDLEPKYEIITINDSGP
jgi:hypothetical protein